MATLMIAIAIIRRVVMRRWAKATIAIGAGLLAMAAGQPMWTRPAVGSVAVMVDLSPSTRGATFRDRAALLLRVHQLIGDRPYRLLAFSDRAQPLPGGDSLTDLSCERTIFSAPPDDAILLFSDGQFELPTYAPPIYPVIDPALDHPADAAVTELKSFDQQVLCGVRNNGPARTLQWTSATPKSNPPPSGDFTQLATPADHGEIVATLSPGDLWPENDSLSLSPAPPAELEQWWIGTDPPPNWHNFDPSSLSVDSAEYLRPAIIVLNNVPADALSSSQQLHLLQYVRGLGGSLLINGGDRAFAAGHYEGTLLDDLSPLASSPPKPTMQWLLLIDGSGSMAGDGSPPSPWQTEVTAVTRLLPALPAHDAISIGSFAESLTWWSSGKSVLDTRRLPFPPPNLSANGPTNLATALMHIASDTNVSAPGHMLLMTDADTDLPNPGQIAAALNAKKIHLHLLAIGNGKALLALQQIASLTGGSVIKQLNAQQWTASANVLLRSAIPDWYQHKSVVTSQRTIADWNQTWLKSNATAVEQSGDLPLVARWQLGLGKVTAIAYPAGDDRIQSLTEPLQPRDPRFTVTYTTGSTLHIEVNAIDQKNYLNDESIQIEMLDPNFSDAKPTIFPLRLTAPGQYDLNLPASRTSRLITIRTTNSVLSKFAIAGRYAPEFEAIGNNHPNLQALADRTGGLVINPGPVKPIDFNWPARQTDFTSLLTAAAFFLICLGLVLNRNAR